LIEFLSVDSSLNIIILNNCSIYFKLTLYNVECSIDVDWLILCFSSIT